MDPSEDELESDSELLIQITGRSSSGVALSASILTGGMSGHRAGSALVWPELADTGGLGLKYEAMGLSGLNSPEAMSRITLCKDLAGAEARSTEYTACEPKVA